MPGYIYLIMMADGVYKVGRTQQDYGNYLKRLKNYPGDSVITMVLKVYNDVVVEKEVLRRCRLEFGNHPRGLEYFKGPEEEFVKIIYECRNFSVPPPPPPPPLQRVRSQIDYFLGGNNTRITPRAFVPLDVMILHYLSFCQHHKSEPIDFREYCPLPIVFMQGLVTWRPIHNGPERVYENPEVVSGVSLFSCYEHGIKKLKTAPVLNESLETFMNDWDEQRVGFTTLFRNLRTRFPGVFFKYSHLVNALRARGYIVDSTGFVSPVSQKPLDPVTSNLQSRSERSSFAPPPETKSLYS
jgi:hypothetical protein